MLLLDSTPCKASPHRNIPIKTINTQKLVHNNSETRRHMSRCDECEQKSSESNRNRDCTSESSQCWVLQFCSHTQPSIQHPNWPHVPPLVLCDCVAWMQLHVTWTFHIIERAPTLSSTENQSRDCCNRQTGMLHGRTGQTGWTSHDCNRLTTSSWPEFYYHYELASRSVLCSAFCGRSDRAAN